MNKTDDILERLKGQQPKIDDPNALTDRIMDSLPDLEPYPQEDEGKAHVISIRRRWIAAASLLIIIGIGSILWLKDEPQQPFLAEATVAEPGVREQPTDILDPHELKVPTPATDEVGKPVPPTKQRATAEPQKDMPHKMSSSESDSYNRNDYLPLPTPASEAQTYNAAMVTTVDTLPYQDPARMDEFIAKMADFNNVKAVPLDCSPDSCDNTIVSTAYVFDDKEDFDLFARLLQAACWYDSKTPGYLLNYTHQQLYFTLKDLRKKEKHLWIAERVVGGHILLFSTHSPIEADVSSACYQKYREQLTHTNFSTLQF